MSDNRIGLWLIGAKGGISTTLMTGLAALRRDAMEPVGLVTETAPFTGLSLVGFGEIVVGGHDIRSGNLFDEARRMWVESRAITPEMLDGAAGYFSEVESRLRPGTIVATGDRIRSLADMASVAVVETPRDAIARIRADIEAFQKAEGLAHVIVVNVASTEPPPSRPIPKDFAEIEPLLDDAAQCPLPASSLYCGAVQRTSASEFKRRPRYEKERSSNGMHLM